MPLGTIAGQMAWGKFYKMEETTDSLRVKRFTGIVTGNAEKLFGVERNNVTVKMVTSLTDIPYGILDAGTADEHMCLCTHNLGPNKLRLDTANVPHRIREARLDCSHGSCKYVVMVSLPHELPTPRNLFGSLRPRIASRVDVYVSGCTADHLHIIREALEQACNEARAAIADTQKDVSFPEVERVLPFAILGHSNRQLAAAGI